MRSGLPDGLFISLPRCREVGFIQRLYIISTAVRSGLPDRFITLVLPRFVRLVSSNGYIYYFHDREVGFTRRFIIIIIITSPFEVEGREVGVSHGLCGYMVRYIVGF